MTDQGNKWSYRELKADYWFSVNALHFHEPLLTRHCKAARAMIRRINRYMREDIEDRIMRIAK